MTSFQIKFSIFIIAGILSFTLKSQVRNGGFEEWRNVSPASDSIPESWFSYELVNGLNTCGQHTAIKSDVAHNGNSAMLLEPYYFCELLPGRIYSIEDIPISGSFRGEYLGDTYKVDTLPESISFYYKYQPKIAGDSVVAKALVYHYDDENKTIDTIAYGETYITKVANNYTQHQYKLDYHKSPERGKDVRLFLDFTTSKTLGTKFWLDDVSINAVWTGIELMNAGVNTLNVYPNPVNDYFQINLTANLNPKAIELFDAAGKVIKTFPVLTNQFKISELKPGIYYLRINTETAIYSAKIQKKSAD